MTLFYLSCTLLMFAIICTLTFLHEIANKKTPSNFSTLGTILGWTAFYFIINANI